MGDGIGRLPGKKELSSWNLHSIEFMKSTGKYTGTELNGFIQTSVWVWKMKPRTENPQLLTPLQQRI